MIEALTTFGFVLLVGACGASFTLGVALVCRWLEWSPINLTIHANVNTEREEG